jgi:hypothetical protein
MVAAMLLDLEFLYLIFGSSLNSVQELYCEYGEVLAIHEDIFCVASADNLMS